MEVIIALKEFSSNFLKIVPITFKVDIQYLWLMFIVVNEYNLDCAF